jgi:multidrug efflux pump subunit AcrB
MWLVALALRRPYTFVVIAIITILLAVITIRRMGTDLLPEIDIPIVAVVFTYNGMSPDDMEKRVISGFERFITTTVNDIEHIESQSLSGMGLIKIYFHPGAKVDLAIAQVTSISESAIRAMPPGMTPPIMMKFNAANVPVLMTSLGSETLNEQQIFDIANNFIRTGLATVQGAQVPNPYGGRQRGVIVDLDPKRLQAYGLSAGEVTDILANQNLVLPAGSAKIGDREYPVRLNSNPASVAEFNDLPLRQRAGGTVFLHDVATVRDGFTPQTSLARVDGRRGVIQFIRKVGGASTVEIVARARTAIAQVMTTVSTELSLDLLSDQSVFVIAAIKGVLTEGLIAAGLTGLLILLFLGSWRTTLIVIISIPLSVLTSIIVLSWMGYTLNLMTLGGLALAVGILVDDATVEVENIHRNLHLQGATTGRALNQAILTGASQIAVPTFVSTLCICIVFIPVLFITGPSRSLFIPMSVAVVAAMLTSYFLSRTLVPTLVSTLLRHELTGGADSRWTAPFRAVHRGVEHAFTALQRIYGGVLDSALDHRALTCGLFAIFIIAGAALVPRTGRDLFPNVDAGQIRLHVRCQPNTRIEETERRFAEIEEAIRDEIPVNELERVISIIGMPSSPINLILGDPSLISAADGEIQVFLTPVHHPTPAYLQRLRERLASDFPEEVFFSKPADLAAQVTSFGLPAPIDIQIVGPNANLAINDRLADRIVEQLRRVPGAADVRLQQVSHGPEFAVDVDRAWAIEAGLSQHDVADSVLVSLSSSSQTSPGFWLDSAKGVQYNVSIQQPQRQLTSLLDLMDLPIASSGSNRRLGEIAAVHRSTAPVNITHYNVARTVDVLAGAAGTDLGTVVDAAKRIIAGLQGEVPRGTTIRIRGQAESMDESFSGLSIGLIFSIVLIYLLLVINFQSWTDPAIIISALPAALAGIVWTLFATQTTISVPALMGAIMGTGVATANSILVVSFANDLRAQGLDSRAAALRSGLTRLRPVLMTAAAMVVGMIPMALAHSQGGEQNAPLGRAVIGALLAATLGTLFLVPIVYSYLGGRRPRFEDTLP